MLATLMAGFLISLAGAPPMAGAWAKLFVFARHDRSRGLLARGRHGRERGDRGLVLPRGRRRMFLEAPDAAEPVEVPTLLKAAMGIAALALFVAFIYPKVITDLAERSLL